MDLLDNFIRKFLKEINARELRKKLKKLGCTEVDIKGSHLKVRCPPDKQVVIPIHKARDIKTKTLKNIEKALGIKLENTEAEKYERWQQYKEKFGYKEKPSTSDEEDRKVNMFHRVVEALSQHMDLTDHRKKIIWENIKKLDTNGLYWLASYLALGGHSWHDIKKMVLPGYV